MDYDEEDVLEPDVKVLDKVKGILNKERGDWETFQERKKIYTDFLKERHKPIDKLNPYKLVNWLEHGLLEEQPIKPEWKYKKEVMPRVAVLIDDCMGTDLMTKRNAGLTKFIIAHRHWAKGMGCSVYMLVQSYCSHDGVARPIRENTCLLMLWKVKDEKQKRKIIEEAGLDIPEEEFNEILEYATDKKYGFLTIDFNPRCSMKQFRSGFNEYLTTKNMTCKCHK